MMMTTTITTMMMTIIIVIISHGHQARRGRTNRLVQACTDDTLGVLNRRPALLLSLHGCSEASQRTLQLYKLLR